MPVDPKPWKETWERCRWASAFSSPLWHAATAGIEPRDATFAWKGIITPLREIRLAKGLIKGYESAIPGVPAGPISTEMPDEGTVDDYWQELDRHTRGKFLIHLRPDSPFIKTRFKTVTITTHILRVKEREKKLTQHHQRQIRKAKEQGIHVTPARRQEDFEVYWEMYEASLGRWDKKPAWVYPKDFFEKVWEILVPADVARFFIAWKGEQPQSAALVLYEPERAVYWHGASFDEQAAGAGHILHWEIMRNAEERGIEIYDFGPSPGLAGVERFKQGFGAEPEEQVTVLGSSRLLRSHFLRGKRR